MLFTLLLSQVYIVRTNESTKTLTKTLKDARACIFMFFLSLPVQSICKIVKSTSWRGRTSHAQRKRPQHG